MNVHEVMMEYLRGLLPDSKVEAPKAPKSLVKVNPSRKGSKGSAVISILRGESGKVKKDKNGVPFSRSTTEPYVS